MFHTPNRLMLGGGTVDHYALAQTLGLNAYWPLNDAAMTATPGTVAELIGGSDGTYDNSTPTSGGEAIVERQAAIMTSSVSDKSAKAPGRTLTENDKGYITLGEVTIPADGNCSFEVWMKWEKEAVNGSSDTLFGAYNLGTTHFLAWKSQFSAADTINFPFNGVTWDSGGASTSHIISFGDEGADITTGTHLLITQSKSGSNYTKIFYINGVKAREKTDTGYIYFAPSATNHYFQLSNIVGNDTNDVWWQSAGYYTETLTAENAVALYNAGKL